MADSAGSAQAAKSIIDNVRASWNVISESGPNLQWGIRATLQRSSGLFILTMATLSVALSAARVFITEMALDKRRVTSLEELFTIPQEPRRNDRQPVLAATLLGSSARWSLCSPPLTTTQAQTPTHENIAQVIEATATLFAIDRGVTRFFSSRDQATAVVNRWIGPVPSRPLDETLRSWSCGRDSAGGSVTANFDGVSIRIPSLSLAGVSIDCNPAMLRQAFSSTCTNIGGSSTGPLARLGCAHRRPGRALLDQMLQVVSSNRNDFAENRPQIQRFFFVAWNSTTQVYQANAERFTDVPMSYLFSGASYVASAASQTEITRTTGISPRGNQESSPPPGDGVCTLPPFFGMQSTMSRPYLDLLGTGAVSTICYRIDATSRSDGGVFCADISLPRDVTRQGYVSSDSAAITLVRTQRATLFDTDRQEVVRAESLSGKHDCTVDPATNSPPAECPDALINRWILQHRQSAKLEQVDEGGRRYFIAITWRGRRGRHQLIDIVIASSPQDRVRLWSSLLLTLIFAAATVGVVIVRRNHEAHIRRWAAVAGLPTGVIIGYPGHLTNEQSVDDEEFEEIVSQNKGVATNATLYRYDSRILTINDRAEELLWDSGKRPTWKENRTWFSSLIARSDKGSLEIYTENHELLTLRDIARDRSNGRSSTYYILARHSNHWLKVTGSVVLPSKASFATVERASCSWIACQVGLDKSTYSGSENATLN